MRKLFGLALVALLSLFAGVSPVPTVAQNFPGASGNPSSLTRPGGIFYAPAFFWTARVINGNSATGSATVTIVGSTGGAGGLQLVDGTTIPLQSAFSTLMPVVFDLGQGAQESVTPTAVSVGTCPAGNLGVGGTVQCVNFTGTFVNTHGQSAVVGDATFGLQTAMNYARSVGGGVVTVDPAWTQMGGTNALISAAVPYANVAVADYRSGSTTFWNAQGGATTLAAPATLVNATAGFSVNGANLTGGAYTGSSSYIACIAYVDALGQEGPCSATFTIATSGVATTDQIGFTAPAASTGAVGYTIYISLAGGSYTLAYKVPLVTQPSAVGAYPASNGVCTLTTIETITPACALGNTTYNQTGVGAVVSALTLNTSPIPPQSTVISTTTVYVPQPGGRTTYTYAPGSHVGASSITVPSTLAFTIGAAAATTVPDVVGTVNIAPGAMNVVGKILEICGEATTTASTATIVDIQFQWDAVGQNTAGKGIVIGDLTATPTAALATTGHAMFCQDFQTTVASATATGGSINHIGGSGAVGGVSLIGAGALSDAVTPGTVGSLNLAADARINIIYLHTTGTDGAGWTLQNVTAKLI